MGITSLLPSLESITHKVTFNGAKHYRVPSDGTNRSATGNATGLTNAATIPTKSPSSMIGLLRSMVRRSDKKKNEKDTDFSPHHEEITDRYLNIGVDISTWIGAACHGNGAELIDERHFSRYGRKELAQRAASDADEHRHTAVQQDGVPEQQEQLRNFIKVATESVLRKIKSIQYLLSPQIIVVLDGASPPVKKETVEERQRSRAEAAQQRDAPADEINARSKRRKIGAADNVNLTIASDRHEDNVNIHKISAAKKAGAHTSEMYAAVVCSILQALREHEIPFLVSPYEADGQLTYLAKQNYIDLIVSEDSDFVPCGAKATLYKYRADIPFGAGFDGENHTRNYSEEAFANATATATLILREDLGANTSMSFSLWGFTDVMIAILCVAAGCDYARSLKGIGLVSARNAVHDAFMDESKYVKGTKLEKVWKGLFARSQGTLTQAEKLKYRQSFLRALVMFRHPLVFDPVSARCVFANIDSPDVILMDYPPYADIVRNNQSLQSVVGEYLDSELAIYVAEGWINPKRSELRYNEQETPQHIVHYLRRWKDIQAQKKFQMECDLINGTQTQSQQGSQGASHPNSSSTSSVPFTSPTPPSADTSSLNPLQSTAGYDGYEKPFEI